MLKVVFFFLIKWSKLKTLEKHLYLYIKRVHVVCAVIIGIVLHSMDRGMVGVFCLNLSTYRPEGALYVCT